jgi:Protein of unknown function (DUF2442)
VPLVWFPVLRKATSKQLEQFEIGGGGISLHWPELDEDLSVAGLILQRCQLKLTVCRIYTCVILEPMMEMDTNLAFPSSYGRQAAL